MKRGNDLESSHNTNRQKKHNKTNKQTTQYSHPVKIPVAEFAFLAENSRLCNVVGVRTLASVYYPCGSFNFLIKAQKKKSSKTSSSSCSSGLPAGP